MKKPLMILVMASSLVGCGEGKVNDVQYYLDHPEEREDQIAKCYHNPSGLGNTQNCHNALTAEARISPRGTKSVDLSNLNVK
jgi:hypothetical protein